LSFSFVVSLLSVTASAVHHTGKTEAGTEHTTANPQCFLVFQNWVLVVLTLSTLGISSEKFPRIALSAQALLFPIEYLLLRCGASHCCAVALLTVALLRFSMLRCRASHCCAVALLTVALPRFSLFSLHIPSVGVVDSANECTVLFSIFSETRRPGWCSMLLLQQPNHQQKPSLQQNQQNQSGCRPNA